MFDTRERHCFWRGYESALFSELPRCPNDLVWTGWAYGVAEREKYFQVDKWFAVRRRFRDFVRINSYWLKKGKFSRLRLHPSLMDVRGGK
jgi:hypothetical protein